VILFALKERLPSRIPTLAEARTRWSLPTAGAGQGVAKAAASALQTAASKGGGLTGRPRHGAAGDETGLFSRANSPRTQGRHFEELATAAFTLAAPAAALTRSTKSTAFRGRALKSARRPTWPARRNQRKQLREACGTQTDEAVQKRLEELKAAGDRDRPQCRVCSTRNAEENNHERHHHPGPTFRR